MLYFYACLSFLLILVASSQKFTGMVGIPTKLNPSDKMVQSALTYAIGEAFPNEEMESTHVIRASRVILFPFYYVVFLSFNSLL